MKARGRTPLRIAAGKRLARIGRAARSGRGQGSVKRPPVEPHRGSAAPNGKRRR
jgi:hypothetical protein